MDKKQIESKKESAKALYLTAQYTQEEISNMVGISRVSRICLVGEKRCDAEGGERICGSWEWWAMCLPQRGMES